MSKSRQGFREVRTIAWERSGGVHEKSRNSTLVVVLVAACTYPPLQHWPSILPCPLLHQITSSNPVKALLARVQSDLQRGISGRVGLKLRHRDRPRFRFQCPKYNCNHVGGV